MLLKGEGIVLKSIKYGEKSQICSVFTKEYGVLSVIHNRIINKKRSIAKNSQLNQDPVVN